MGILKFLLVAAGLAIAAVAGVYVVSPPHFLRGAVAAERWVSGLQHKTVEIPGFRIEYLDSEGSGAPLLLIHGFGGDKDNWTRIARHLRPHYRIIALDLPGYGDSHSPMDTAYGIVAQTQRVYAFVQALGLTRIHIGGNSMGGNIAAHYAIAYPNTVGSLWLVANSGVASAPLSELRQRIADSGENGLISATPEQYRSMLKIVMSKPPPLPDPLIEVMAAIATAARPLRERQFADLVAEGAALEPIIAGLPIPTHIVWGAEDRVLHVGAVDILMGLLPQASKTVMPGIGHVPMIEAPHAVAEDYIAFRASLNP